MASSGAVKDRLVATADGGAWALSNGSLSTLNEIHAVSPDGACQNQLVSRDAAVSTLDLLNRLMDNADAAYSAAGGTLQHTENEAWAPSLHTLAYLPAEEVAFTMLQVLERFGTSTSELSAAYVAEHRMLEWAHEWLELSAEERARLARLVIQGAASLPAPIQARYFAIVAELRCGSWELPVEEHARRRVVRGVNVGRGSIVAMAALNPQELDALENVYLDALSENFTLLGVGQMIVRMEASKRKYLAAVLVHERILSLENARKLFRSLNLIISALGEDKVESMLSALDTASFVGSGAIRGSGAMLSTAGSFSYSALNRIGTVSCEVVDVLGEAATASAGAAIGAAASIFSTHVLADWSSPAAITGSLPTLDHCEAPQQPSIELIDENASVVRVARVSRRPSNSMDFI